MASGGALTLREMDYDPERSLWIPRWGRRGFLSLGLGALAALALPAGPTPDGYVQMYLDSGAMWVPIWTTYGDTVWLAS